MQSEEWKGWRKSTRRAEFLMWGWKTGNFINIHVELIVNRRNEVPEQIWCLFFKNEVCIQAKAVNRLQKWFSPSCCTQTHVQLQTWTALQQNSGKEWETCLGFKTPDSIWYVSIYMLHKIVHCSEIWGLLVLRKQTARTEFLKKIGNCRWLLRKKGILTTTGISFRFC